MTGIPLSQADIGEAEIAEVVAVLRGGRLSLGPKLTEFEAMACRLTGRAHAVAVSSGTAGLHLSMLALGIRPGDEVIVPSFTFVAVASAVRYVGATPVFVDIDAATLNLDPARVEAAITERTRAMVAVHTFGVPAQMDALREIAARYELRLIEDACEALGASWQGRPAGSFGDTAVFAFYPNKQITTGEGGLVVTDDAELARAMRAMRNHGRYESDAWHQHSVPGYNYRLSEIQCALGCAQMRRLDEIVERRAAVAARYDRLLAGVAGVERPPLTVAAARISWFVYVVRLAEAQGRQQRDAVVAQLAKRGVSCGRYFAPIHQQQAFADVWVRFPLPVTEAVSERTIALPFFTALDEASQERVASALADATEGLR